MAFSKGVSSSESAAIKRYMGIGLASVIAVNPTREEFNKIFNSSTKTNPINYTGTRDVDGKKVKTARISFILKLDAKDNNGIDTIIPINFNLEQRYRLNRNGDKIQVIDEYARTTWVTKQELDTHAIPIFSNGPAKISPNYRPVLRGEENLVKFMKAFLGIEDVEVYNNDTQKYEENKNKKDCIIIFDRINDYFNGDISEIKEGINLLPDNKVKVLFGVRHTDDNNDYQDFFNSYFMKARQRSITMLKREFLNSKNGGMYPNTDFAIEEIHVYEGPSPTTFEQKVEETSLLDNPFAKENVVDDLPFGFN